MRILVAVPAVSLGMSSKVPSLKQFLSIERFDPTIYNLDVFPTEMAKLGKIEDFWSVNVPHWALQVNGTKGVAGPGRPQDELFYPSYLAKTMKPLCGKYDKWRPYPAVKPLSNYSVDMAHRFAKKRCKMFEAIAEDMPFQTLFYVEHSPASLAHVSKKAAVECAEMVIESVTAVAARNPAYELVIFSPYGVGSKPGFVVSNRMEASLLSNWTELRNYLNGSRIEGPPETPAD